MPRHSPFHIRLTEEERQKLEAIARKYTSPYRDVIRAKIILLAARGYPNDVIAQRLEMPRQVVSKWRKRFFEEGMAGQQDRPRRGRPPAFPPEVVVEVKAMACELPYTLGLALSRWSLSEIRRAAVTRGIVASIGTATLWRWLSEDAIRPWFHRSWIFPRDRDFARKAGRVLDLYHRLWDGRGLGHREYVICADEKTSIQARARPVASQPPAPARRRRVEHEYERMGGFAHLAAWDVHRARLLGRCERQTGIEPFDHLVDQVMAQEPYRSAHRVFWIVDNGSSHRGERAARRLRDRWPRLVLVHLPVHASWLNQIEIYFSILQRKVLTPKEFNSLEEAEVRILRFQAYYQEIAQPFQWRFIRQDLEALLKRVDADRVVHDSCPPGRPASPEYVSELTASGTKWVECSPLFSCTDDPRPWSSRIPHPLTGSKGI